MRDDFSIRRYRPTDRKRVETVMEAALQETGAYFEETPDDESLTPEERYLESGGEFLVGELDNQIVATGAFRPPDGFLLETLESIPEGAVELKQMHVAPDHQRQGYGQQILNTLQQRAREEGHTTLLLETTGLQSAAQHFYEANGFEEVTTKAVEAEGRAFDVVFYQKALSPQ